MGVKMAKEAAARNGKYWIDSTLGIVRWAYNPGTPRATLEDAQENHRVVGELLAGQKLPFLCDLRNCAHLDQDARKFYAGKETADLYKAMALLGGTPLSNMIGNIYLAVNRTSVPTKLFTSEADAIAWLRGFV